MAVKYESSSLLLQQVQTSYLSVSFVSQRVYVAASNYEIARIMRMLVGMGVFKEVGKDTFMSTPLAATYVTGSPLTDAVTHMFVDLIMEFHDHIINVPVAELFISLYYPGSRNTSKSMASKALATHTTAHSNTP